MANSGLLMMLKSFGINPDEIIKDVTGTLQQYGAVVVDLKQQMNRIETRQKLILQQMNIADPFDIPADQPDNSAAIAALGVRKHG